MVHLPTDKTDGRATADAVIGSMFKKLLEEKKKPTRTEKKIKVTGNRKQSDPSV